MGQSLGRRIETTTRGKETHVKTCLQLIGNRFLLDFRKNHNPRRSAMNLEDSWRRVRPLPNKNVPEVIKGNLFREKEEECTDSSNYWYYVHNFLQQTSLHGAKYLSRGPRFDRMLWKFCYLVVMVALIYVLVLMQQGYPKQVFIAVADTHNPIWNVDFPAITICNVNKIEKSKYEAYMAEHRTEYSNLTERQRELLFKITAYLSTRSPLLVDRVSKEDLDMMEDIYANYSRKALTAWYSMIPTVKSTFMSCMWMGNKVKCADLFDLSLTDSGYCFSFNSRWLSKTKNRTAHQKQLIQDFLANATKKAWNVNTAGFVAGMAVTVHARTKEYFAPAENFQGFKIVIHSPNSIPLAAEKGIPVGKKRYAVVAISATSNTPAQVVRDMKHSRRGCSIKGDDTKQDFSKLYTYDNCILACRRNTMRRLCHCIPLHYVFLHEPRRLCNFTHLRCIISNRTYFHTIDPKMPINDGANKTRPGMTCDCPRPCVATEYSAEVTQPIYNLPETSSLRNSVPKDERDDLTRLRFAFKDFTYMQYQRNVLYTWHNVVADFGGITSLFIGFSIISFFEIIYFFIWSPIFKKWFSNRSENKVHVIQQESQHRAVRTQLYKTYNKRGYPGYLP